MQGLWNRRTFKTFDVTVYSALCIVGPSIYFYTKKAFVFKRSGYFKCNSTRSLYLGKPNLAYHSSWVGSGTGWYSYVFFIGLWKLAKCFVDRENIFLHKVFPGIRAGTTGLFGQVLFAHEVQEYMHAVVC